jgi:hypothetical protein
MDISFAHFDFKENLTQQRELFRDCFPETNGDVIQDDIFYKWKFHSFPNKINAFEYASYIGSEMVGYYAAIPYRYKIGNQEVTVGMVCDVMTSSHYRGKGIFTKMGKYSTAELSSHVPFLLGYPIRKEVIPGHLKVGWEIPFSMPLYIKFIRFDSLLKTKNVKYITPLLNIFIRLFNIILKTRINKQYSYELTSNLNDFTKYEAFVKEWSKSVPNALIKDSIFANWRYGAPGRSYHFLSINNQEGCMIGFVSFRKIIKEGVPSFGILDYMLLPEHMDAIGLVNKVMTDLANKENVEAIMTMMSNTSCSNYKLYKNGFIKSPFVFQLIIKNLTKILSDKDLFNEKNWHLMWVDSDDL